MPLVTSGVDNGNQLFLFYFQNFTNKFQNILR